MTGLDTNILVRYLTHDHPLQTAAAQRLVRSLSPDAPGFVSMVVIVELIWVLQAAYGFEKTEIEQVLETLLRSQELIVERAEIVSQALRIFRTSRADFSDGLIERCANAAGCDQTVTFDRRASTSLGMRLLA